MASFTAAQVLHDHVTQNPSELNLLQGEILLIHPSLQFHTETCWVVATNSKGQAGLVPATHVKKVTETVVFSGKQGAEAEPKQRKRKRSCASGPSSEPQPNRMTPSTIVPRLQLLLDSCMLLNGCNDKNLFNGIFSYLQLAGNDIRTSTHLRSSLKCWLHQLVKRVAIDYIKLPKPATQNTLAEEDFKRQICFAEAMARIHLAIAVQPVAVARLIRALCVAAPRTEDDQCIASAGLLQLAKCTETPSHTAAGLLQLAKCTETPGRTVSECAENSITSGTDVETNTSVDLGCGTWQKIPALVNLSATTKNRLRPQSPNSPIHFNEL